tara:strand:+ start:553 stop:744 length:192 start_codon:yes stop_codon:yes gene_type:complete
MENQAYFLVTGYDEPDEFFLDAEIVKIPVRGFRMKAIGALNDNHSIFRPNKQLFGVPRTPAPP